ncbi:MAG: hypothetical protein MMC33_005125 [Icmadophila ericetorum]|nr:hypothetical protein [Icmadophila ericetorum]
MASKIIVLGGLGGRYDQVFEKVSKIHAKNAFAFAIAVGDFFADPSIATPEDEEKLASLLKGEVTVPLPVYFNIGKYALPEAVTKRLEDSNGEVCSNLYFLGKRSTTKTSEGIRIVALGGSLDPDITAVTSKDKYLPFYTEGDAKTLHGANTADILITSTWPTSIKTGSKVSVPEGELLMEEQCISYLCATLKPKYHFSSSPNFFYEREPFFHQPTDDQPGPKTLTRFISLASFSNPSKQKWLYAFSLDPKAPLPITLPIGTTGSPLTANPRKRAHQSENQSGTFSRYAQSDTGTSYSRFSKRHRNAPPPTAAECFFCLSNPSLATHLITSIGTDAYLTTAKGPLTTSSTFPSLGCPAHILIIPLSHSPTISLIPSEGTDGEISSPLITYAEMQRYRSALHTMLVVKGGVDLGAVTWEVSRAGGIHVHWQFLPVQKSLIDKGLIEAAFKVEAENEKYPLFRTKDIGDGSAFQGDFFRVWIWRPGGETKTEESGEEGKGDAIEKRKKKGEEKSLILPLSAEFRFDVQFGRRVMAKLLGLEGRFDWKACSQSQEEEIRDASRFKQVFKEFDFSLEE